MPEPFHLLDNMFNMFEDLDCEFIFEVRAVDNFGRVEPFANQAEASIIVDVEPPFVEPRLYIRNYVIAPDGIVSTPPRMKVTTKDTNPFLRVLRVLRGKAFTEVKQR